MALIWPRFSILPSARVMTMLRVASVFCSVLCSTATSGHGKAPTGVGRLGLIRLVPRPGLNGRRTYGGAIGQRCRLTATLSSEATASATAALTIANPFG